jgi:general secretion pathway protein A
MLSGVETTKEKVLRIILAGQPELNHKLDAPALEQLTQRVRLRFHLQTLSEAETQAYIQHRLDVAGAGDRELFTPDTFVEIYRYCGGVPRLINTLCDTAMMAAFTADRAVVTRRDIATAVEELRWTVYAARPHQHVVDGEVAPAAAAPTPVPAPGQHPVSHRPIDSHPAPPSLGHLLVATDGRTVQDVPLRVGRLIVGRTPDNDVQIDSRFVSRHHCQVITTLHSCVIEDLNSTNGIYVKSNRVRRHYLNDGDVVLVGKHELIYVDERAGRSRTLHIDTVPNATVRGAELAAAAPPTLSRPAAEEADDDTPAS